MVGVEGVEKRVAEAVRGVWWRKGLMAPMRDWQ